MNVSEKLPIALNAIRSITRHDDETRENVFSAVAQLKVFIASEEKYIATRPDISPFAKKQIEKQIKSLQSSPIGSTKEGISAIEALQKIIED